MQLKKHSVDTVHLVMLYTRTRAVDEQVTGKEGEQQSHLQNLLCCLDPFQLEVGHPNSLGQALLLAVR